MSNVFMLNVLPLTALLPALDGLMSTQGIMVVLLMAYAGAMWMFLSSAPKVYTVMVSDLVLARELYEGLLNLPAAEVPLHYYYNYEQTLGSGAMGMDSLYLGSSSAMTGPGGVGSASRAAEGLWYQLRKNTQLHVISGASLGDKNRQRHVCFDRDCLDNLLMRIQTRGIKYKIRREKPLNFLLKDYDGRIFEMVEMKN